MTIKQQIEKFFEANPNLKKSDSTLYHTYYQITDYQYLKDEHKLTITSTFSDQKIYAMERIGKLHSDLLACLKKKEEIVFFWSHEQLNASNLFFFIGEGYYWTIFPKKDFTEKQKAQEWLESQEKYSTEEKRNEVTKLEFANWKTLEGDLDLSDFKKLKAVYFPNHQLKKIDLSHCSQLARLSCPNNQLIDINSLLSSLNPEKLKELDLSNNNFAESDLTPFSKLVNLEELNISNNNFYGSLEPFKNLTNLKELYIHNTDISSGLEYLPDSLETFKCYDALRERSEAKVTKLYHQELSDFGGDIQIWKEFHNSPAQQWLDEEYPGNSEENLDAEESLALDFLYQEEGIIKKKREEVKSLVISDKNLTGALKLKGFTNLEELSVSNNQLTKLDLRDCPNLANLYCENNRLTQLNLGGCEKLVKLNCSNNKLLTIGLNDCLNLTEIDGAKNDFFELDFLGSVGKLKILRMKNNQKLALPGLRYLSPLERLEKLDISSCSFEGSLKPLQNLNKLAELDISNTNLSEGLEHLPSSCKKLYCNSDYHCKSIKIMEELEKSNCSENEGENKHYIPSKWREDKQNSMIASIIPLERLYVIRGNIRGFVNKWGIKKDSNNLNEISKLQSPEELWKRRWVIYGTQLVGRSSAVAGAVLTFQDQGSIGGGILAIYPFTELAVSKLEENLKNKEDKWREFLADADTFLDNYNELLGILSQFEIKNLQGEGVSQVLKDLNGKIREFLKMYDNDENGEVDVGELIEKRKILTDDLNKGKEKQPGKERSEVWEIVEIIKELESAIIKYRKSSYDWINEKEVGNQSGENGTEIQINIEDLESITETENQTKSIANNSSHSLLLAKEIDKGKKTLFDTRNYLTNRRKKYSKNQKALPQESHELQELSGQEQLETQIEVPPYGTPGSSKK